MSRFLGIVYAALAAIILALAPTPRAEAAPIPAGTGQVVQGAAPALTTSVQYYGRRHYRRAYHPRRYHYRRAYYRPVYVRPRPIYRPYRAYYGPRCFIRPAQWVYTPYGYRLRPARRVCRY